MVLGIPGPDWSASPSAGRVGPAPFRVGITSRENQPQGITSIKREGSYRRYQGQVSLRSDQDLTCLKGIKGSW